MTYRDCLKKKKEEEEEKGEGEEIKRKNLRAILKAKEKKNSKG